MKEQASTSVGTYGLKVIGAGFGRTGTLTLKTALEELGFGPCYHMIEVFGNTARSKQWYDIVQGKRADWDTVFAGYQATVDWPGCAYYEELMEAYPDAKVILTVRDPERWYESSVSIVSRLLRPSNSPFVLALFSLMRIFVPVARYSMTIGKKMIAEGTFHGQLENKDYTIAIFKRHIETVKKRVPPERLLVFEVKEGWGPLCDFLGVEVPDKPFPHLNERENFFASRVQWQQLRRYALGALLALTGIAVLGLLLSRKKKGR